MIIIDHRRNTIPLLLATSRDQGIEVDIRSSGPDLIIHHDPFEAGERFDAWIQHYEHRLLILNTKEEGLEKRLLEIMNARGIDDFFFLDQSFPFLMKTARGGESRCAVRVSEYESLDTAVTLAGLVKWVWVDCFTRFPLSGADAQRLQSAGFSLCLVSPELQGRDPELEIPSLRALLKREGISAEAVCTKRGDLWSAPSV